jgi:hypothetical protein
MAFTSSAGVESLSVFRGRSFSMLPMKRFVRFAAHGSRLGSPHKSVTIWYQPLLTSGSACIPSESLSTGSGFGVAALMLLTFGFPRPLSLHLSASTFGRGILAGPRI